MSMPMGDGRRSAGPSGECPATLVHFVPNHCALTTVTKASGTMPRMAALVWSCSSFIMGRSSIRHRWLESGPRQTGCVARRSNYCFSRSSRETSSSTMLAMERCSHSTAARNASLRARSVPNVNVAVLPATVHSPEYGVCTANILQRTA